MTVDTPPTSFDINISENPASAPPDHIKRRMEAEAAAKKELTIDEVTQKLEEATERKRILEEERVAKAKADVEHAKAVAAQVADANAQSGEEVEAKLEAAEQRRKELELERVQKIQDQLKKLDAAQAAREDASGGLSGEELEAKLEAAEARRKELKEEMLEKLREEDRRAEEVRRFHREQEAVEDEIAAQLKKQESGRG
ncbi:MAG: hypothetical protein DHS80DRAFT_28876 [Piptocephalis tieghemiana]|nr:MAG: hypothetical protein DHS80DRAFT_28876 [Piptocephalis tieghemiana]